MPINGARAADRSGLAAPWSTIELDEQTQEQKEAKTNVEYNGYSFAEMSCNDSEKEWKENVWAAFDDKNLEIHIFDKEECIARKEKPRLILYGGALVNMTSDKEQKILDFTDNSSNIKYRIEAVNETKYFEAFLKHHSKLAEKQAASLTELSKHTKKYVKYDQLWRKLFKSFRTWNLTKEQKDIVDRAHLIRNEVWNLLIDVRRLMHEEYINSYTICSALQSWDNIFNNRGNLTETDSKRLSYGLSQMEKSFSKDKENEFNKLLEQARNLHEEIMRIDNDLRGIYDSLHNKIKQSGLSKWAMGLGVLAAAIGVIGIVIGAMAYAPVWIPCGAVVAGGAIGFFIYKACRCKSNKTIMNNCKDIETFKKYNAKLASVQVKSLVEIIEMFRSRENRMEMQLSQNELTDELKNLRKLDSDIKETLQQTKLSFNKFSQNCKKIVEDIDECQKKLHMC